MEAENEYSNKEDYNSNNSNLNNTKDKNLRGGMLNTMFAKDEDDNKMSDQCL